MRQVIIEVVSNRDNPFSPRQLGLLFVGANKKKLHPVTVDFMLAHDLVEHQGGLEIIGDYADELEALGAIIYIRGWNDPDLTVVSDVVNVGTATGNNITKLPDIPAQECVHEEEAGRLLRCSQVPSYHQDYQTKVHNYLVSGYNKAHKNYGCRSRAWDTFERVKFAARDMLNDIRVEGQRFMLAFDENQFNYCEMPCPTKVQRNPKPRDRPFFAGDYQCLTSWRNDYDVAF